MIESHSWPDLDDRHVLAAAIRAGAAVIVTTMILDADEAPPFWKRLKCAVLAKTVRRQLAIASAQLAT